MTRRDALKAALFGAALAAAGPLAACAPDREQASARADAARGAAGVLDGDDEALVAEIADTLLPATAASPGAKAAGAGPGVNLLLTGCYEPDEQRRVVDGLRAFRATCRERQGAAFAALTPRAREALLREVDAERGGRGARGPSRCAPAGRTAGTRAATTPTISDSFGS